MGNTANNEARRWSIVALLFFASLINYLDRVTLSVSLPDISADLCLGSASKGLLLSSFFWSYALMQLPAGWLVDRYSLRWLYAVMFTIWCVACGLSGVVKSLVVLIGLRVALGVGESVYLPAATKIVLESFSPQDRGLPSGIFNSGARAGLAIGGPLVAVLSLHYGWRRMFFIVGFSALAWLVPWLLTYPTSFPARSSEEIDRASQGTTRNTRFLTMNRNLLGICLGFFCFDYYVYLLITWLPDYLVSVRHLTLFEAGFSTSFPFLVFGISEPLGGWIADRFIRMGWDETRTRKGIVIASFLTGLLLIPATHVKDTTLVVCLIAGASLVGFSTGNLTVILQCCAPNREVGRWTGIENFAGNIGGVVAPVVMGFLVDRTGSYQPGFELASGVIVAGAFSYALIVRDLRPPDSD